MRLCVPTAGVPHTGCQPVWLGIRVGPFRDLAAREVRSCVTRAHVQLRHGYLKPGAPSSTRESRSACAQRRPRCRPTWGSSQSVSAAGCLRPIAAASFLSSQLRGKSLGSCIGASGVPPSVCGRRWTRAGPETANLLLAPRALALQGQLGEWQLKPYAPGVSKAYSQASSALRPVLLPVTFTDATVWAKWWTA